MIDEYNVLFSRIQDKYCCIIFLRLFFSCVFQFNLFLSSWQCFPLPQTYLLLLTLRKEQASQGHQINTVLHQTKYIPSHQSQRRQTISKKTIPQVDQTVREVPNPIARNFPKARSYSVIIYIHFTFRDQRELNILDIISKHRGQVN